MKKDCDRFSDPPSDFQVNIYENLPLSAGAYSHITVFSVIWGASDLNSLLVSLPWDCVMMFGFVEVSKVTPLLL